MADNYPVGHSQFLAVNRLGFLASLSIILLLVSNLPFRRRFFMWILNTVFTPSHENNSIYKIIGFRIFAWAGWMVMLLVDRPVK